MKFKIEALIKPVPGKRNRFKEVFEYIKSSPGVTIKQVAISFAMETREARRIVNSLLRANRIYSIGRDGNKMAIYK